MEALQESYLQKLQREHKERRARFFSNPEPKPRPKLVSTTAIKPPEPPSAKRVLKPELQFPKITFDGTGSLILMLGLIADYFGATTVALRSEDRHHRITRIRQIACAVLYQAKRPRISSVQLGNFMGGRDHSTVVHAIRKVTAMCVRDPKLQEKVSEVACMCSQLKWPKQYGR